MRLRFLLPIFFMYSGHAVASEVPTMTCLFETFILVIHDAPSKATRTPIHQSMKIINGNTDENTLKLDGTKRAINSNVWKAISPKYMNTRDSIFVGDFGELLSLSHDLNGNEKRLRGWHKASLVSDSFEATDIRIGNCVID